MKGKVALWINCKHYDSMFSVVVLGEISAVSAAPLQALTVCVKLLMNSQRVESTFSIMLVTVYSRTAE